MIVKMRPLSFLFCLLILMTPFSVKASHDTDYGKVLLYGLPLAGGCLWGLVSAFSFVLPGLTDTPQKERTVAYVGFGVAAINFGFGAAALADDEFANSLGISFIAVGAVNAGLSGLHLWRSNRTEAALIPSIYDIKHVSYPGLTFQLNFK